MISRSLNMISEMKKYQMSGEKAKISTTEKIVKIQVSRFTDNRGTSN